MHFSERDSVGFTRFSKRTMAQKKKVKSPGFSNSQRKLFQQRFFPREKFERDTYPEKISRAIRERYQCSIHILYYLWEWYYIYPKFKTVPKVYIKILLPCEMGELLDCK